MAVSPAGGTQPPAVFVTEPARSASCCYQAEVPRIIILTAFDLDEYVYAALAAGASGFTLKFTLKEVTPDGAATGSAAACYKPARHTSPALKGLCGNCPFSALCRHLKGPTLPERM